MPKNFCYCEKCNKKLIERLPNGLFKFVFGKKADSSRTPPVYMLIHGSVKMKCIRKSCGHFNTFSYFPINQQKAENSGKNEEEEIILEERR